MQGVGVAAGVQDRIPVVRIHKQETGILHLVYSKF